MDGEAGGHVHKHTHTDKLAHTRSFNRRGKESVEVCQKAFSQKPQ